MNEHPLTLEQSILATLAYFDIAELPLTSIEVWINLYRRDDGYPDVLATLDHLVASRRAESRNGFFTLPGRTDLIEERQRRIVTSQALWRRVMRGGAIMRWAPFIEWIAVCNRLALDNTTPSSDIDLLISVRNDRIWMTRLLVTAMMSIMRFRRHGQKIAGRICLSFYVTPAAYDFRSHSIGPEDVHFRYWASQLVPIIGQSSFDLFWDRNVDWIQECIPNARRPRVAPHHRLDDARPWLRRACELFLGGNLGSLLERLLGASQRWWMDRARIRRTGTREILATSGVVISHEMLKFHERDRRAWYRETFVASCMRQGITPFSTPS